MSPGTASESQNPNSAPNTATQSNVLKSQAQLSKTDLVIPNASVDYEDMPP